VPIIHEILPTDITDDTSAVHDATAQAAVLSVLQLVVIAIALWAVERTRRAWQARLAQLKALLDQGLITAEDMALVSLVDDTEAVIQVIRDFYADREFAPSAEEEHLLRHL